MLSGLPQTQLVLNQIHSFLSIIFLSLHSPNPELFLLQHSFLQITASYPLLSHATFLVLCVLGLTPCLNDVTLCSEFSLLDLLLPIACFFFF